MYQYANHLNTSCSVSRNIIHYGRENGSLHLTALLAEDNGRYFVLSLFGGRASTAVDITVVVADDDFDQYALHKTRLPRPDADTAGVEPVVWVVEQ